MTQLSALKITKAQFDQIPEAERLFYFMAGQLLNDLNVLSKLLIAAKNEVQLVKAEAPKRSAAIAQVLLLLKLTAGRLYEGHKMIGATFSASKLRVAYKDEMTPNTIASLDAINKYFGQDSTIQRIRTKFGFHLDARVMAGAYANLPSNFETVEYVSPRYAGHSLFHAAETISLVAIIGDRRPDWQEALNEVVDDITGNCVTMGTFLMGFVGIIFKKFLDLTARDIDAATITISDDPCIDDVRLPFFCQPPEGWR